MTMKKNKKCCCCCWLMAILFLLLLLLETGVGGAAVVSSTSSSSAATTSISGSGGISGSSLVMTNQTAVQSVHQQRINRHRQQQQQHQMVVNVRIERTNNCSQIPTIARQLESMLTSASQQLHDISGGRLRWQRIRILSPPGCSNRIHSGDSSLQMKRNGELSSSSSSSSSWSAGAVDMVIGDSHPLLGDLPHAQQFSTDCGGATGRGRGGVRMSRQFILRQQQQQSPPFLAGRQVLREWIKHRYGVFDERGFDADALYPLQTSVYGSHPPASSASASSAASSSNSNQTLMANRCTTTAATADAASSTSSDGSSFVGPTMASSSSSLEQLFRLQDDNNNNRTTTKDREEKEEENEDLLDDANSSRSSSNHYHSNDDDDDDSHSHSHPQQTVKVTLATSIMAQLEAADFCDASNHIGWIPTKHNVLCNERSVWQVMRDHSDFATIGSVDDDDDDDGGIESTTSSASDESPLSSSPFRAPQFDYVVEEEERRYVLVIDRQASPWPIIRRALYCWIHSLPNGTYLSVVVSGQPKMASPTLGWTRVTTDNRDGLVGRLPRRSIPTTTTTGAASSNNNNNNNFTASVLLAKQMLRDRSEASQGDLILITTNNYQLTHLHPHDATATATAADQDISASDDGADSAINYNKHLITTPLLHSPSPPSLADGTIAVAEATAAAEPQSVLQARLTSALLQILRDDKPDTPTQVYQETVSSILSDDSGVVSGRFTLDQPLGANVWLVVHCHDTDTVDALEAISPSGRLYDLPLVADGLIHIRIAHTQEYGEWRYRLRFAATAAAAAVTVQVTAQPHTAILESTHNDAITVEAWTSLSSSDQIIGDVHKTPIVLYVQVRRGLRPVMNARVDVRIRRQRHLALDNQTSTLGEADTDAVTFRLYDRGTGDPDLTKADGIYSGYLTQLVDRLGGHYQVEVEVSDDSGRASFPVRLPSSSDPEACCGSSMPYGASEQTPRFRRFITGPQFVIAADPTALIDLDEAFERTTKTTIDYPPSRISDLRVQSVHQATTEAELTWTAPGGDLDAPGTAAAQYEIRCYTDRSALNDSSAAILVHASLTPQPGVAGSVQLAKVAVPWPNQLFYYAIVALDAAGQRGKVSNIVPVFIDEPPTTTTTTTTTTSSNTAFGWFGGVDSSFSSVAGGSHPSDQSSEHRVEAASALSRQQLIYVVAGAVAGFILLLAVLSAAVCVSSRRRKQRRNKSTSSAAAATNNNGGLQQQHKKMPTPSSTSVIKVEPLVTEKTATMAIDGAATDADGSRPVYKIYVNNAYIQEEDGELKIVTPDGRIIQRGSPWFSSSRTLPRGRSLTQLEEGGGIGGGGGGIKATATSPLSEVLHWSLPRTNKASPHRHKVLTNGSIMQLQQSGASSSQIVLQPLSPLQLLSSPSSGAPAAPLPSSGGGGNGGVGIADGTSISSKPSVSSDDTGIEVSDSRDAGDDLMILPPPGGFGPIQQQQQQQQQQQHGGYLPMAGYGQLLLPPLPPSPASQDARVVRIPSYLNHNDHPQHQQHDWMLHQPNSRRPVSFRQRNDSSVHDHLIVRTPQISPTTSSIDQFPFQNLSSSTSSSPSHQMQHQLQATPKRKTRHISFV